MELKTLKELGTDNDDRLVWKILLKQEAIKWIKKYTTLSKDRVRFKVKEFGFREFMNFFNITDEDLE